MTDYVYVVLYNNPTGAGALLKGVWRDHDRAVAFINRQTDPTEYRVETKAVQVV